MNAAAQSLHAPHGQLWALLAWIAWMAVLFAQLEIQIEGPYGWAAALPTWRVTAVPPLHFLFGGREITGYHVFAFTFMLVVFHLPLVVNGCFTLQIEARILSGLMLFWMLEDFLWFALNPAFGLARLTPQAAPWHPYWVFGIPVDYLIASVFSVVLIVLSFRQPQLTGQTQE